MDDRSTVPAPGAGSGSAPAEDRYAQELVSLSQGFRDLLLSYMNEVRKEKNSLGTQLERQLLNALETRDGLAGYLRQYKDKKAEGYEWVEAVYLDLEQKLDRAGVTAVEVKKGEPYDEVRHEILNLAARPADFGGRPAVRSVVAPGYYLKGKVLRRAGVEVDWQ